MTQYTMSSTRLQPVKSIDNSDTQYVSKVTSAQASLWKQNKGAYKAPVRKNKISPLPLCKTKFLIITDKCKNQQLANDKALE